MCYECTLFSQVGKSRMWQDRVVSTDGHLTNSTKQENRNSLLAQYIMLSDEHQPQCMFSLESNPCLFPNDDFPILGAKELHGYQVFCVHWQWDGGCPRFKTTENMFSLVKKCDLA